MHYEYTLKIPGSCFIPEAGIELTAEVVLRDEFEEIQGNPFMGQFDFDKINGNLKVRNKRPGDRFKPLGLKGTKNLKIFY